MCLGTPHHLAIAHHRPCSPRPPNAPVLFPSEFPSLHSDRTCKNPPTEPDSSEPNQIKKYHVRTGSQGHVLSVGVVTGRGRGIRVRTGESDRVGRTVWPSWCALDREVMWDLGLQTHVRGDGEMNSWWVDTRWSRTRSLGVKQPGPPTQFELARLRTCNTALLRPKMSNLPREKGTRIMRCHGI